MHRVYSPPPQILVETLSRTNGGSARRDDDDDYEWFPQPRLGVYFGENANIAGFRNQILE